MSFSVILLLVLALFPVHAGKLVMEPGRMSYISPRFAFHSEERTLMYEEGNFQYGRLDLSPEAYMIQNPHGNKYALTFDAKDSVKTGVRGMVWDSDFVDVSFGFGKHPQLGLKLEKGKMDLLFDIQHKEKGRKKLFSRWKNSLEMDVITVGANIKNEEYGLSMISLLSFSPSSSTEMFTGLSMESWNISFRFGRGNTLMSRKKAEESVYLKVSNQYGSMHVSSVTGDRSFRPSSYTETEKNLGFSLKLGKLEIGQEYKSSFTEKGKWKRKRNETFFLDFDFARLSIVDGKLRFSMEPVSGFSIGVGSKSTSISFKYKGLELKRTSRGEWSFRVTIEMP